MIYMQHIKNKRSSESLLLSNVLRQCVAMHLWRLKNSVLLVFYLLGENSKNKYYKG